MSSNAAKASKKRKKNYKLRGKLFFWRKAKEKKLGSSVVGEEENSLIDEVSDDSDSSSVKSLRKEVDTSQADVHETTVPVHAPDLSDDVLSSKKLRKPSNDSGEGSVPKEAMRPPINRSNRSDVGSEKVKSSDPKVESTDPKVKLPGATMQSTDPKVDLTDSKVESPEPKVTDDASGLKTKESKDSRFSEKNINANERENPHSVEESGISVRFHALLPSGWGFDQSNVTHRVWIRFGANELGDWKINYANMKVVEKIMHKGETYLKLCGSHTVPHFLKKRPIPYKYVFVKWDDSGQKDRCEYVTKGSHSGSVNRVLEIPFDCEGVFDKYDDAIHPEQPEQRGWTAIIDTVKHAFSTPQADGREAAILSMIPKWKGFHCNGNCDQMSAKEAVRSFISTVWSLVHLHVLEEKPNCSVYPFTPSSFKEAKIIAQILKLKIKDLNTIRLLDVEAAEDRVLSAVALSVLMKEFKVESYMDVEDFEDLSRSLFLTPDLTKNTCSYEAVLENFSNEKERICEAVKTICRAVCKKQSFPRAVWLLAMPLLHFLSDLASPFEPPRKSDHRANNWWMLCGLRPEIDSYRTNSMPGFFSKQKEVIDSLLRLDPSLGRVIMVSHKPDDLKELVGKIYPCETIRSLEKLLSTEKHERLPATFVENSLLQLASLVSTTDTDRELQAVYSMAERQTAGSVDLLPVLRKKFVKKEHRSLLRVSIDLVFACVKLMKQLQSIPEFSSKDGKDFCDAQLRLAAQRVCERIQLASLSNAQMINNEMKVWNFMLKCASLPQDLQEVWEGYLKTKLTEKLREAKEEEVLKAYCDLDESECHAIIRDSFTNVSEIAMKKLLSRNGDQESAFERLIKSANNPSGKGAHSRRLLNMMIETKCPPLDASDEAVLHSLLTWPVWIHFLGIRDNISAKGDDDFSRYLARGKKVLSDYVEHIVSGAVTVKQFRLIMKNKGKFLELCHRVGFRAKADWTIADRSKELNAFEEKKRLVNNFVGTCKRHGNVSFDLLNYGQDVSDSSLSELAVTQDGTIKVVYFNLSDDVDRFIKPLDEVRESIVFQEIWVRRGNCLRESQKRNEDTATGLKIGDIIRDVVRPAFEEWGVRCQSVVDGSISLVDVLALFGSISDSEGHLKKELFLMQTRASGRKDVDIVFERATQIAQFTALNGVSNSARAIERVRCSLGILKSYPSIEKILSQSSSDFLKQPLTSISSDVVSASRFLSERKPTEIECLNKFTDCDLLINWIRKDIKEWKELETFVELAETRSSAEGDYEAMKVAHLRAACVGFSAFLFGIGENASLLDLQKACMTVFKKLERDQKIPDKWRSSQDCLEEFKAIKKSLGSVEITSLSQVEEINSRGRYTVECQSEISDCIYLDIIRSPEDGVKAEQKRRSLSDLQDLQSKLILISGHKSERRSEVNVFIDTLENVMRLATNLLALCRSGHVGYLSWSRSFDCVSPLDYADDTDGDSPTKRIEKLLEQMRGVASKMERDLKNWKQKMASLRSQYYYLNYFTTSQLLILSKELGSVARDKSRSSESLPAHVYALLDGIKPNVSADEVASCLQKEEETEDLCQLSSLQQFSEQSFGSVFDGDFPSAFGEECWDVSAETSAVDALFQNRESVSSSPSEHSDPVTDDVFDPESDEYLSFSRLGNFLEKLSLKATRPPLRAFPSSHLKLGYPNLVVVPRAELLASVLRFYMSDAGSETSLPSAEEVLLCSSSTTVEDVCLFWRRAIKDPNQGRLFCLAGADQLSYQVSREAVDELSRLGQGLAEKRGDNYRLVIICSAENADKSYMVSALDEHRKDPLPPPTAAKIAHYLKVQFQRGPAGHRTALNRMWTSAAQKLDPEQSCVRVVYSTRAGVGKSLFIDRMEKNLATIPNNRGGENLRITIPVHEISVNVDVVLESLKQSLPSPKQSLSRLIHLDISPSVKFGLDHFLFNLLVLGQVTDSIGHVWRRRFTDMYVLECTWTADPKSSKDDESSEDATLKRFDQLLPNVYQNSPGEILADLNEGRKSEHEIEFSRLGSEHFQRAFEYLHRLNAGKDLTFFAFSSEDFSGERDRQIAKRLETILKNCGVPNPSWAVVRHFATFLGSQMRDAERNHFCNPQLCNKDLPGFKNFVLNLLIKMSRDFSTPSLNVDLSKVEDAGNLTQYQVRRRWEHTPHPYLFFNEDRHTITFVGLQITRNGHLMDSRRKKVLQSQIMTRDLSTALHTQGFRLQEDYKTWTKARKIKALCQVMGLTEEKDVDTTYELTPDNLTKIMAIQMRFRCGIPVVVMGETGCGKTRLIRYMCALQAQEKGCKNMLLMKVHGGVTRQDVINKVKAAEELAQENSRESVKTVLFFDEANTTDAVGLIKEVMCDQRVNGRPIVGLGKDLHVIAACNPYRKHTDVMIEKLDSAGLGYHVRTGDTEDRLGDIPLRQLVYRVHPLPESMKALVWDFGQLDSTSERLYILQIVARYVKTDESLPNVSGFIDVVTNILAACQAFMRQRSDECSFVSLRDVERAMRIMVWFYKLKDVLDKCVEDQYKKRLVNRDTSKPLDSLTRSVVLSLGVSYYARLEKRRDFLRAISGHFRAPCTLFEGQTQISEEIEYCQTAFLDELELPPKIGKNHALKENIFMMVVCIDLRIPLFLVGKPGSSKSLAKDVVKNAMRGDLSNRKLFKRLKQVHMVSYQCSPLSTADGIISTFHQCQKMQRENDLEKFVACVVLDEVGLAEDSPRLPLKSLHPLLDDGTAGADDDVKKEDDSNRVAFVGISNWALDPAKMNRGIFVQREVPTDDELVLSAEGISSTDARARANLTPHFVGMAKAYLEIYNRPKTKIDEKEFFGLRDFYSLVKMMFSFCKKTGVPPTWNQFEHAIKRNFGGLEIVDCVGIFQRCMSLKAVERNETRISQECGDHDDAIESHYDKSFELAAMCDDSGKKVSSLSSSLVLDSSPAGLIRAHLGTADYSDDDEESRYLLLLTENYAALNIVRQQFLVNNQPVIIFGSSFSKDQKYTQICRNINRIKVCMATGRTVVLLNLENLYESLYDTLNQYYVRHGGQRFVDLGLGSHRVKCQVHDRFRLILIANREVVYEDYPIPLINRMEKHFLAMSSILTHQEQKLVERITEWVKQFADVNSSLRVSDSRKRILFRVEDAFIGYHSDAVSTVVLRVCRRLLSVGVHPDETLSAAYDAMLQCATPDAVARLSTSAIREQASDLWDVYFTSQKHSSLADFVENALDSRRSESGLLIQVTTHSRLLSSDDTAEVGRRISFSADSVSLQQFDTEHQFAARIRDFYALRPGNRALLIILCESGDVNGDLVACARYVVQEERQDAETRVSEAEGAPLRKHVVFVIHLPRIAGRSFVGFQGGSWTETHIDNLRPANQAKEPSITSLEGRKISELLDGGEELNIAERGRDDRRGDAVLSGAILLRSCLHGATSRLDDDEALASFEFANRRLSSLLVLIPENETCVAGHRSFYHETRRRIVELLREREERMGEENSRSWVKYEALNPSGIQAGGTFRHSLWLKIVNIVTPIFSEIIASIDVDANLSLLTDDSTEKCVSELWMKIFSSRGLLHLCYEDLISPSEYRPRQRILVHGSGCQGHSFRAQFPFSKLAKEKVDDMTTEAKRLKGHEPLDRILQRLFDDSTLGSFIKTTASNPIERKELTERYLSDFVHMVYNPINDDDFQMMNEAVVSSFIEMTSSRKADSVERVLSSNELTIPAIHAAYDYVQSRIRCFAELRRLHPHVVRQVYHRKGSAYSMGSETSNEMNLDAFAFHEYVEEISPKKNDLVYVIPRREWLERVQEARSCIETWLALPFDSNLLPQRAKLHSAIQNMWIKMSVIRLFFYHTSLADEKGASSFVGESGLNLWKAFDNKDPDFASASTMRVVLEILNNASQLCSDKFFRSTTTICPQCSSNWTNPIQLPCRHVLCSRCVRNRMKSESQLSCPSCEEKVPNDFNPEATPQVLISAFSSLRAGCTSFFIDLVSTYSFSETASSPPQPGLIRLLMSLVTGGEKSVTRAFSPFHSDAVDRTPVFRSFILQLLLQLYRKESMNYIEEYFSNAERALTCDEESHSKASEQSEELVVIFVQCVEDAITRKAHRERDFLGAVVQQIKICLEKRCVENTEEYSARHLEAVAAARFVFSTVADCIFSVLKEPRSLNGQTKKLLAQAKDLCTTWNDSNVHFFLLKQLVLRKGIKDLAKLRQVYGLEWVENLVPQTADRRDVIPDYCVVIGPSYQTVRVAVARAASTGVFTDLNDTVQAVSRDNETTSRTTFLLLALHREVTMRRASMDWNSPSSERIRSSLKELFSVSETLPSWAQPIATQLIENTLGGNRAPAALIVKPDQSPQTRAVAAVAVHARIALESSVDTGNELMTFLRRLFKEPDQLVDSYLPTMPEDNFLAVKGVIKDGKGTKWHACPNGHPFFIDNCGCPMEPEKSRCACGAQIGGEKSIIASKSTVGIINRDITEKGYLLELPSSRPDDSFPERNLSSVGCALVRLLVDAALMWASCVEKPESSGGIRKLIKSNVPADLDLPSFFWDHFEKDVENFAEAIDQTPNDACAVIHQIFCSLDKPQSFTDVALGGGFFSTKSERSAWENDFSQKCLDPVLQSLDAKMTQWMLSVVKDGNNPLMRWLYELEPPPEAKSSPPPWRYRSKVTLQHLSLSIQRSVGEKTDDQPRILIHFLKQERRLRVLRFLPEVLRLQRGLRNKFHRRLAMHEAEKMTIETFLHEKLTDAREKKDFTSLIELFTQVWNRVGAEILSHGRLKPPRPEDRLEKVTKTTPIAFLLPTTQGRGTCAMSLVDYLINCVNNEFLAEFRRLAGIERLIAKVPMAEVTRAHLISYDFEKDLLPLVLAHCRYSLEVGTGAAITYDYKALERQLVDRFLLGKPHIDFKVHEFVFSNALYRTALFARVERNIPQENLDNVVSSQILDELRDLTDIFSVLRVLDVLIGFAVSIGGERDAMMHEYLHDTLKMKKNQGLISSKAQQCCRLKHTLSLWRVLTVEKGRRLVLRRQDPFDDFPQRFKDEMSDDLKSKFKVFLKKVKIGRFLEESMTLAWLELKHRDDVTGLEEYTLKGALEDMYHSQLPGLSELPEGVQLRHLVDCWSTGVLCQDHH